MSNRPGHVCAVDTVLSAPVRSATVLSATVWSATVLSATVLSATVLIATVLAAIVAPQTAYAASASIPMQGALTTVGGGPVADGEYALTVQLYETADAVESLWKEIHVAVPVVQGRFALDVGTADKKNPLADVFFTDHASPWIGVQVGGDPELARRPLARLPQAWHAKVADELTGPLDGKQLLPASVPGSALAFAYAAANQKEGAALEALEAADLKCTGCITAEHLDAAVLAAYARTDTKNTFAKPNAFMAGVGVGKFPADACVLDVASDGGTACVDGAPALMTRIATSDDEMAKVAKDGQLVYRKDSGNTWIHRKGAWRQLALVPICGDQEVDPPETCDDGNQTDTDSCTNKCDKNVCGDGVVFDGVEVCDDGNTDQTDACVACQKAICGDGFIRTGVETCDGKNVGLETCATILGIEWIGVLGCKDGCAAFKTTGCTTPVGTEANPATSCLAIQQAGDGKGDGLYWLKPKDVAFQVFCDMTTDGGGWTLVNTKVSSAFVAWSAKFAAACGVSKSDDCASKIADGLAWTQAMWRFATAADPRVVWEKSAHAGFAAYLQGASGNDSPTFGGFSKVVGGKTTGPATVASLHFYPANGISESHGGTDAWLDIWSTVDGTNGYLDNEGNGALNGNKCVAGYCKAAPIWLMVR